VLQPAQLAAFALNHRSARPMTPREDTIAGLRDRARAGSRLAMSGVFDWLIVRLCA